MKTEQETGRYEAGVIPITLEEKRREILKYYAEPEIKPPKKERIRERWATDPEIMALYDKGNLIEAQSELKDIENSQSSSLGTVLVTAFRVALVQERIDQRKTKVKKYGSAMENAEYDLENLVFSDMKENGSSREEAERRQAHFLREAAEKTTNRDLDQKEIKKVAKVLYNALAPRND